MPESYDSIRMANYGRDMAREHARMVKTRDRFVKEVNLGLDSGVSPLKLGHDLMGRCNSRDEMLALVSILQILVDYGSIPPKILEPFDKGIRPRRV